MNEISVTIKGKTWKCTPEEFVDSLYDWLLKRGVSKINADADRDNLLAFLKWINTEV